MVEPCSFLAFYLKPEWAGPRMEGSGRTAGSASPVDAVGARLRAPLSMLV